MKIPICYALVNNNYHSLQHYSFSFQHTIRRFVFYFQVSLKERIHDVARRDEQKREDKKVRELKNLNAQKPASSRVRR